MPGKNIVKWVMMAMNLSAIASMLLILAGTIVNPNAFIFPAYFSLAQPIIIVANIFFILFWLLARKWYFILSFSVLLLSATQIKDSFPVHFSSQSKTKVDTSSEKSIHILTYNMMMSGKLVKHTHSHPNKVIQYILDKDADIVCLQEFMVSKKKQYLTHADMLHIFSNYPYKHISYIRQYGSRLNGIATLSKYPIITQKRIKYKSEANLSICSDILVSGETIRVINNHLESNRITENDKSMPYKLKSNFDAENLKDLTWHFSRKLGNAYRLRANQADAVAKEIEHSPHHVLLCGDFNDVPGSYAYTKVKGDLKDVFSETGTGFGWTFYQRFYGFRIDYIFYDSLAFRPLSFHSDKVTYSDHYPVFCTMQLRKPINVN